jgi:hypothetical protein
MDECKYLARCGTDKFAVEQRRGASQVRTNLLEQIGIGGGSGLARPAVFGRRKTRYVSIHLRAQKQIERLLIRVEHPVARRQQIHLEAQIDHGPKLSGYRSGVVDEFVPISLPDVRPIAFLHCLGAPWLVLEAKRLAPDYKPLFSQILLEPQARVPLKYDIADIYCHHIARMRSARDLREEIPDIVEPVDRDLGTPRVLFKYASSGIVEA